MDDRNRLRGGASAGTRGDATPTAAAAVGDGGREEEAVQVLEELPEEVVPLVRGEGTCWKEDQAQDGMEQLQGSGRKERDVLKYTVQCPVSP